MLNMSGKERTVVRFKAGWKSLGEIMHLLADIFQNAEFVANGVLPQWFAIPLFPGDRSQRHFSSLG
jgi:hypothetical protein